MTDTTPGATLPHPDCILITTDGSCRKNPGPGGYAAILQRYSGGLLQKEKELTGGAIDTTNNRMEMSAAIAALKKIKREDAPPVILRTDSKLIVNGMNEWLPGWIAGGWRKGDGKPVENEDLWKELVRLCTGLDVTFEWVRGHAGDPVNERADRLAAKTCEEWSRKAALAMFGNAA